MGVKTRVKNGYENKGQNWGVNKEIKKGVVKEEGLGSKLGLKIRGQ